jgi:hypothetical protein
MAGIVILFLTYLVQDIFQSQLRGIRDSMIEAQRIEDLGDQVQTSSQQQVLLNSRMRRIRSLLQTDQTAQVNSANDLREEVSDLLQMSSSVDQHFARLSEMLDALPGPTELLKKERDRLRVNLDSVQSDVKKTCVQSLRVTNPIPAHHILVWAEYLRVIVFALDLIPLEGAVVQSAKNLRVKAERLDHICTYALRFFYLLGFVLSFAGVYSEWKASKVKPGRPGAGFPVSYAASPRSTRRGRVKGRGSK